LNVVMLGPFGLAPKGTMLRRALPAARALARRGHRVTVIMPPWHRPEEAGQAWDDGVPGLRIENVSLAGLRWPLLGHAIVAGRMLRRTLALEPDVVHAFKPKAYAGLVMQMLYWRRRLRGGGGRRPLLVMDTDDWEGPGGWNEIEPYSAWQRRFFAWQERAGLSRHADAVTVASRELEGMVLAMGVPAARLCYLPNAVDDAGSSDSELSDVVRLDPVHSDFERPDATRLDFAPPDAQHSDTVRPGLEGPGSERPDSEPPKSPRPPTVLLYTRFFEFDLDRPLRVLARLRMQVPDARLLVGGKGLFGEEAVFVERAAAMGLADAVDYRGWVAPEALPALLAEADVAIYPFDDNLINRCKSAFKLLELMQAGLPVVAEAVGQNAEVIEDGHSGRLVPSGDVAAFAGVLVELLGDGAERERERLAEGARRRIDEKFSWSKQVERLEDGYRSWR
jgi:glycosyltransferase involved in cell wall biosynthesis